MAPNPNRVLERLRREVWERIPVIENCKGRCWDSCGPVNMAHVEQVATQRAGVRVPTIDEYVERRCEWCPALDPMRSCAVYDVRPTICRLWGAVEALPCPHGCAPRGGRLPNAEGFELLRLSFEIGGWPPGWTQRSADEFARLMQEPGVVAGMERIARGEVPVEVAARQLERGLVKVQREPGA